MAQNSMRHVAASRPCNVEYVRVRARACEHVERVCVRNCARVSVCTDMYKYGAQHLARRRWV